MQKLLRSDLKSLDQNDKTAIDTYLTAMSGATSYSILSITTALLCVTFYIESAALESALESADLTSAAYSFVMGVSARLMVIVVVVIQWLAWERRREASLAARSLAERSLDVTGLPDSIFSAKYYRTEYTFLLVALALFISAVVTVVFVA